MQFVIGEGWRRLAIYLSLSSSALQNGWSIVFKNSLLFWVALMRSRSSQMLDIIFPLISLIYTDIPRICVHPCSSVGSNISPCPAGRNLNYLNQVSCFYSWDSLDFSSVASRRIYIFRVSVFIRAICGSLCSH